MLDPLVGVLYLLVAAIIAGRLFIGAHYPSDVGAGLLVGLAAALLVLKLARPLLVSAVGRLERATVPLLRPICSLDL